LNISRCLGGGVDTTTAESKGCLLLLIFQVCAFLVGLSILLAPLLLKLALVVAGLLSCVFNVLYIIQLTPQQLRPNDVFFFFSNRFAPF